MPILALNNYDISLLDLNDHVYQVFANSANDRGGERNVVKLRQHERGLPLTLRDNYSPEGHLFKETESRDIPRLESEFQNLNRYITGGNILCVPIHPLTNELLNLEKHSPKMAGYLVKRLEGLRIL